MMLKFFVTSLLICHASVSAETLTCPADPNASQATYVNIGQLIPAQIRYSQANTQEKVNKAIKDHAYFEVNGVKTYCFNHNSSIFSSSEPIPVIKVSKDFRPEKSQSEKFKGLDFYILIDGHHSVMASRQLGAKTMPIKIIDDMSSLKVDEVWTKLKEKGYAHLTTIDGEVVSPPQKFKDLIDDSIRGFMAKVAIKCVYGKPLPKYDAATALWVKVTKDGDKDIPFIEFKAADALKKAGFAYANDQIIDAKLVDQSRSILIKQGSIVEGLKVLVQDGNHLKVFSTNESLEKICGLQDK
ncbi:MAG: ParB-like protein [Janthinobacterium lividum]